MIKRYTNIYVIENPDWILTCPYYQESKQEHSEYIADDQIGERSRMFSISVLKLLVFMQEIL